MNKTKRMVPAFATEAEEAEWWFRNRGAHGIQLLAAVKSGEVQVLTKGRILERLGAPRRASAQIVALRIP